MINIYIEDNYIIFEEQSGNKITEHKKQVIITPHFQDTRFVIKNIRQYPNREFDVNPLLIKNKLGANYTIQTFKELVVTETGVYGKTAPPATDYTPKLDEIITAIENNGEKELVKPITEFTETIVGTGYEYLLLNTGIKIINSVEMGEEENINNTLLIYEIIAGTTDVKLTTSVQIPSNYYVRITGQK